MKKFLISLLAITVIGMSMIGFASCADSSEQKTGDGSLVEDDVSNEEETPPTEESGGGASEESSDSGSSEDSTDSSDKTDSSGGNWSPVVPFN